LLEHLAAAERLTVDDAAARLGVSPATVRRDFDSLARQRKLVRLRGAAIHRAAPAAGSLFETPGVAVAPPQGRRIAGQVSALVRPGAVVGLAGGALLGVIARALGVRFDAVASGDHPAIPAQPASSAPVLTVVTNDLAVAADLARRPALKVVTTGGVLDAQSHRLTGPLAGLLLHGVSLDTAVVAADAVDPEFGVTAADEVDAEACALLIARARQVIVAAASADLDRAAFARICGTDRIDVLVTDSGAAPATVERFANRGVRVVTG
jgi:DeoR/GlpR family transcriptional regulator of sugar metabolism